MSSMRNAIQRRNHRERAQPQGREKWGILEKHKDYALRAADYKAKKARIKSLRRKAADRNPDEFYFGMMSAKVGKDGNKMGDRGNKALSQDAVRLLKTQDAAYLKVMTHKAKKETMALEQAFVLGEPREHRRPMVCGGAGASERERQQRPGGHIAFVASAEEQSAFEGMKGKGSTGGRGEEGNPGRAEDLHASKDDVDGAFRRRRARLEASRRRQTELEAAERALDAQRARMAKTRTVGGVDKWGVKWKVRERRK
ncbi:MAG: hypothetical protein M1826_003302 [Phylliscum demangeonii]|nr:MAG: hypothetical protein M1826_003302 [Phylliscum demangeonii]